MQGVVPPFGYADVVAATTKRKTVLAVSQRQHSPDEDLLRTGKGVYCLYSEYIFSFSTIQQK